MPAINFSGWWTGEESRPAQREAVFYRIRNGIKTTTIREPRKDGRPHAKLGDELSFYWAMRQRDCELIAKAKCVKVSTLWIMPSEKSILIKTDIGWDILSDTQIASLIHHEGFTSEELFWASFEERDDYAFIEWNPDGLVFLA